MRIPSDRTIVFPEDLTPVIEKMISPLTLRHQKKLAERAAFISKTYHLGTSDRKTLWNDSELMPAFWAYHFPIWYAKLSSAIREAKHSNFFDGVTQVLDIGSGVGLLNLCLFEDPELKHIEVLSCEINPTARELHSRFHAELGFKPPIFIEQPQHVPGRIHVLSQVLNEFDGGLNPFGWGSGSLILEPATSKYTRRLMELRSELIQKGYHIYGPCTHHESCPLLIHSKKDWCHDRIPFKRPVWFRNLETLMELNNRTITYSYLLFKDTPPSIPKNSARVIGDTRPEKGKIKQAVCRGPDREFLSWLTKNKNHTPIAHGSLVSLPQSIEKKGSELRITEIPVVPVVRSQNK